jgi:hypothetical protein
MRLGRANRVATEVVLLRKLGRNEVFVPATNPDRHFWIASFLAMTDAEGLSQLLIRM